ncbi:hypothetical protein RHGRI_014713 [Rhododendron griersonianum]|uniref:Uncharacterized protein n=1 Tax=Rhododendron griersonianum TaxID=479676 RepID=A0AAV6KAG5_9ERIC|nr:hypothetical protein RHGRI_014713 [Rhododendron griersonianum]
MDVLLHEEEGHAEEEPEEEEPKEEEPEEEDPEEWENEEEPKDLGTYVVVLRLVCYVVVSCGDMATPGSVATLSFYRSILVPTNSLPLPPPVYDRDTKSYLYDVPVTEETPPVPPAST